jgi:hypothetical protein
MNREVLLIALVVAHGHNLEWGGRKTGVKEDSDL